MILFRAKSMNFLIMLMLVFSTGGLFFVFNRNYAYLLLVAMIFFSMIYNMHSIKKAEVYSSLLTGILVSFLFLFNFLAAPVEQSATKYLFFGIIIFSTIFTVFYFNNQSVEKLFLSNLYKVLKLILYYSLISFLVYFLVKDQLFLITSEYHESLTFNYLFYYSPKEESVFNLFGIDFHRNAGVFWEAGILQAYLNILFFLELSYFNKDKKLLALILLGVLTTYSTTGLALIIVQIVYFLRKEVKNNIVTIILFTLLFPLYFLLTTNINEKVNGENESSFQKRLFDLTQPFFIAVENPLTGVGLDLDRFNEVREEFYISSDINSTLSQFGVEQKVETTSKGSTNSVMYLLAGMGFPTAILFIWMFIKQQVVKKHREIWFIITFVTVMSEPLLLRPFFLMFIISGFISIFNKITTHKQKTA
jgi:hypothetical protein